MIKDFKENEKITALFLVNNVVKGISNKGVPYMNITLQDASGVIEGKKWMIEEKDEEIASIGKIIEVTGEVLDYKNTFQIKILAIETCKQSVNVADFVQSAPIDINIMIKRLNEFIDLINNIDVLLIVQKFVEDNLTALSSFPAATRNHHEYCGGLLHHVLGMLEIAKSICNLHPEVDKDLLYAGIILHDIGKLEELSGPFLPKYTTQGKLIGHISIMSAKISEVANKLNINSEVVILLQHMILSHHGKLEFGSPVVPLTLEAELLYLIDNIDSRINMFNKALKEIDEGEFTPHQFPLEGRSLYKPKK